ncbi:MAG: hypothetical protein ACRCVN_02190 [Spirochaetia bacterium]
MRYLINKRVSSQKFVQAQEDMVNQLLVIMSDTVDQHISLIEQKIKDLKSASEMATRKINLLEKERTKFEQGKQTYQELGKLRKPLVSSIIELKRDDKHEDENTAVDFGKSTEGLQPGIISHENTKIDTSIDKRKEMTNYVLHLFKQGKSAQEIARQMNIALAEVDLIISMHLH